MNKKELQSMLIRELKALAKKMKITVLDKAKKADIVETILSSVKTERKAEVKKAASGKAMPKKAAAKKTAPEKAGAPTKAVAKKAAPKKAAPKKADRTEAAAAPVAEAPRKPVVPKRTTEPKKSKTVTPVHHWKIPPGSEEPLLAQERIANAKYYTGPTEQSEAAGRSDLPQAYGEDRIMLMTRDPFMVHAYWELSPDRLEREKSWFGFGSKISVRIYDITGVQFDGSNAIGYIDQEVSERTGSWYFDLGRPSHSFCADLGLLSPEGRFLTLARSNYITTPRDGVSDLVDEEWLLADEEFWKLYGRAEGLPGGVSSAGVGSQEREGLRRRRLHEVTSSGFVSRERSKTGRK